MSHCMVNISVMRISMMDLSVMWCCMMNCCCMHRNCVMFNSVMSGHWVRVGIYMVSMVLSMSFMASMHCMCSNSVSMNNIVVRFLWLMGRGWMDDMRSSMLSMNLLGSYMW